MSELWRKDTSEELEAFLQRYGIYWFVVAVATTILKDADILDKSYFELYGIPYSEPERQLLSPSISDEARKMVISQAFGVCNEVTRNADIFGLVKSSVLRYYFRKDDFFFTDD